MPEYEMRLRFTAADDSQATRLAQSWSDTCGAEYGTRYAGLTPAISPNSHSPATCSMHCHPQRLDSPENVDEETAACVCCGEWLDGARPPYCRDCHAKGCP